jgi:hypothetical protein
MRRSLLAAVISLSLVMGSLAPALAEREHQPFGVNGTVLRIVAAPNLHEAKRAVDGQVGAVVDKTGKGGAVPATEKQYAAFRTSDITGESQIIWLDLSWLKDSDYRDVVNFEDGEAVQVELLEQPDGSFLAIQYWELRKGSKLNNTDWGISEGYTTRDDSIEARVDNGPDDDEARRQGHRYDEKGRAVHDDDD